MVQFVKLTGNEKVSAVRSLQIFAFCTLIFEIGIVSLPPLQLHSCDVTYTSFVI